MLVEGTFVEWTIIEWRVTGIKGAACARCWSSVVQLSEETLPGKCEAKGNVVNAQVIETVKRDPQFEELVVKRSHFAWALCSAMLAIYFGFIFVVAFAPKVLGLSLGGVTTLGIPVGVAVIVSAFVLTGIYVRRANAEFDAITRQIVERTK